MAYTGINKSLQTTLTLNLYTGNGSPQELIQVYDFQVDWFWAKMKG